MPIPTFHYNRNIQNPIKWKENSIISGVLKGLNIKRSEETAKWQQWDMYGKKISLLPNELTVTAFPFCLSVRINNLPVCAADRLYSPCGCCTHSYYIWIGRIAWCLSPSCPSNMLIVEQQTRSNTHTKRSWAWSINWETNSMNPWSNAIFSALCKVL